MAVWSVGWRSALRRADTVSNAGLPRRSEDGYGWVRKSTERYGGVAHGIVRAMCFCIFIAHGCVVCWLAERIELSRYCEQRMSDRSDLSDLSDDWHMVQ